MELELELLPTIALILWIMFLYWILRSALSSDTDVQNFKSRFKFYYKKKVAKINYEFGKGTWKSFIKGDLKETQQVVKNTLSKKIITSSEYSKLEELLDEMETYINNNAQQGSNIELDEEILLLRKINREKVKTRLKEMGRIK